MIERHADKHSETKQGQVTLSGTGYVVGVDIGGTNLRVALADMSGKIVAKWCGSTEGIRDAGAVVAQIRKGVDLLLEEAAIPRSLLRAAAAGAPGVTDVDQGVVIATSYLLGWRDVPLRMLLESMLGVPVTVDNDVNLAALGEAWAGVAQGARDFVFIAIGTGIGAGIVLNRQVFRGMGWTAGEIGYMLVPGVSEEFVERGKPGALESVVGGAGIRSGWRNLGLQNNTRLPEDLTATEIFDHALDGNEFACAILQKAAQALAYAIYNMSLVLSCPLFVLGGGVGKHPALSGETRKFLKERGTRVQPRLEHSILDKDAQLMGAIRMALDTASSRDGVS